MLFLIEYDKRKGELVQMKTYEDSERKQAYAERFALEIKLFRQNLEHEAVILEARSEDIIRKTHRRYFETLAQLAGAPLTN